MFHQKVDSNDQMDAGRAESRGSCASSEISFNQNVVENNLGSPRAPVRIESRAVMEDLNKKDAIMINHKTKVLPPGRVSYEWEWNIAKFEKAFPMPKINAILDTGVGTSRILKSEKIVAGADVDRRSNWHFILSETDGVLSCYLVLEKIHKGKFGLHKMIHTAFTFKIVDYNGKELAQQNRCFRDFREKFQCGWDGFMTLQNLYDNKFKYLVENTFRIRVLFEIFVNIADLKTEALKQENSEFSKIVSSDLYRLRTATGTADVHLECSGKVFPVHKLILSARSPTFARMFESSLGQHSPTLSHGYRTTISTAGGDNPPDEEHAVSILPIPDVEPHILGILLDYIYSGNVQSISSPDVLKGVVKAADKFELCDLKSFCFNSLMNFLTEENIGQLAVLAHRHQADQSVRMNINKFCVRNVATLMRKANFKNSLKAEPDAFFLEDDEETA